MGMARVECLGAEKYRPYRLERVRVMESSGEDSPEIESLRDRLMDLIEKRLELGPKGCRLGRFPLRCSTKSRPCLIRAWLIPCRKLALI